MINKKDFCNAIKVIRDHQKKETRLCDAIQAIDADCAGLFLYSKYEDLVLQLLTKDLCPDSDMIYWWVYDASFGTAPLDFCTVGKDDKKYVITTAESLYDFLTGNEEPIE